MLYFEELCGEIKMNYTPMFIVIVTIYIWRVRGDYLNKKKRSVGCGRSIILTVQYTSVYELINGTKKYDIKFVFCTKTTIP